MRKSLTSVSARQTCSWSQEINLKSEEGMKSNWSHAQEVCGKAWICSSSTINIKCNQCCVQIPMRLWSSQIKKDTVCNLRDAVHRDHGLPMHQYTKTNWKDFLMALKIQHGHSSCRKNTTWPLPRMVEHHLKMRKKRKRIKLASHLISLRMNKKIKMNSLFLKAQSLFLARMHPLQWTAFHVCSNSTSKFTSCPDSTGFSFTMRTHW